jgi:hypothetical protein
LLLNVVFVESSALFYFSVGNRCDNKFKRDMLEGDLFGIPRMTWKQ